jgi:hypothetical protein
MAGSQKQADFNRDTANQIREMKATISFLRRQLHVLSTSQARPRAIGGGSGGTNLQVKEVSDVEGSSVWLQHTEAEE